MKRVASVFVAIGATLTATSLAACSEDPIVPVQPINNEATNTYKLHEGVVQADANVARDAVVREDSISLPRAGNEGLLTTLKKDTVFFGDRAPGAPDTNPFGFLVHVVSISEQGDRIVIITTPAAMTELFDEADFGSTLAPINLAMAKTQGFDGIGPLQEDGQGQDSFTIPLSFDFGRVFEGELGGGTAEGAVNLSGGIALNLTPTAGFRYRGRGWLRIPNIDVNFNCGAELTVGACAKIEGALKAGKMEHDGLVAFDGESHEMRKSLKLGSITIPLTVPPPLVVTGRYEPEIFCGLKYSREIGAAYEYKNKYQLVTNFGMGEGYPYANGSFDMPSGTHKWEFALKGGLTLECGVSVKVGFYLYNSVGLYVKANVGAELGVSGAVRVSGGTGTQTTSQAQACAGFDAKLETFWGAEASIGWVDVSKEWPISTARLPLPFPLRKCAQNFQPSDGCDGKEDGVYCSALDTHNSYACRGGQTAGGGSACASNQYCQGEGGEIGAKAELEGEAAKCATTPPSPALLDLEFCPDAPAPQTR